MAFMRFMLLEQPDQIENSPLQETQLPIPEPESGQVRLKIKSCGVCHTDLHIIEGELTLPQMPIIPGHEIIGVIDTINDINTELILGERVGVGWLNSSCGTCKYCARGQENLCEQAHFTGLHSDGGYAEYTVSTFGIRLSDSREF